MALYQIPIMNIIYTLLFVLEIPGCVLPLNKDHAILSPCNLAFHINFVFCM